MRPRTVLVFGTFDILHAGHLSVFRQAKSLGDRLIVVIARDKTVQKVKGRLPFHTERERRAFLQHIDYVDAAVFGDQLDVYKVIRRIRPDVIALGYDQKAFVGALGPALQQMRPAPRMVRLKPYRQRRHKTGRIRKTLCI